MGRLTANEFEKLLGCYRCAPRLWATWTDLPVYRRLVRKGLLTERQAAGGIVEFRLTGAGSERVRRALRGEAA